MPDNIASIVIGCLFGIIFALALVRILIKAVKNRCSSVKTVPATIVDKQTVEHFSKYAGNGKQVKYVVVFSVNGKRKGFCVSQFSYDGYHVGEKGTLKYKGDQLIEFM